MKLTDANGNAITNVTYKFFIQNIGNGVQQGILRILSLTTFPSPTSVHLSNISDHVGPRSALQDFNQDGIVTGNPFGLPFSPVTAIV